MGENRFLLTFITITLLLPFNSAKAENENSHKYVDLGLSVYWATTNIGAEKETDYGDYFAWGETMANKEYYDRCTYKYCINEGTVIGVPSFVYTKYIPECVPNPQNLNDNKFELDNEDDAATMLWKGKWRMPTESEFLELQDNKKCTWKWYTKGNSEFNGTAGFKVTSIVKGYEGTYIFLPAAGMKLHESSTDCFKDEYLFYWSKSLISFACKYEDPYALCFNSELRAFDDDYSYSRYSGMSVRPVIPKETK